MNFEFFPQASVICVKQPQTSWRGVGHVWGLMKLFLVRNISVKHLLIQYSRLLSCAAYLLRRRKWMTGHSGYFFSFSTLLFLVLNCDFSVRSQNFNLSYRNNIWHYRTSVPILPWICYHSVAQWMRLRKSCTAEIQTLIPGGKNLGSGRELPKQLNVNRERYLCQSLNSLSGCKLK